MSAESDHQRLGVLTARVSSGRRFFLIGIVLILAIIGTTAVLAWMQRDGAIAAYRTATTNLGNGMAQQTTATVGSVDRIFKQIESYLVSTAGATADQMKIVMRSVTSRDLMVGATKEIGALNAVALVGADGIIENTGGPWSLSGRDVSSQDFFIHFSADDDRGVFVSKPLRIGDGGKWVTFLARRLNDAHGALSGIVVGEIPLSSLEDLYRVAMPALRSVSLARQDGVVLVRYPVRDQEIGKTIPADKAWHVVVAQGGGAYHATDILTDTNIIAFARPLNGLPLVV